MIETAWAAFQANIILYLSMPVTSAVVGFATNIVALKMMFYPLEFFGKPPLLGWQGTVPRKAEKMASIAVDTIVPSMVTEREIFDRLDPDRVAQEIEQPLLDLVNYMVGDVMSQYEPGIWESLPRAAQDIIIKRIQKDAPNVVADIMQTLRDDVENIFDLKDMVITTLVRDKALINRLFLEIGKDEFRFIGRSGFYFGFLFGVLQMVAWCFVQAQWQLPAFGLLVGYLTNVLALKLIFSPAMPKKIGLWTFHGLFHKRQKEVASDYARLITDEIVTPGNIIEAVLKGPSADRVFVMIAGHVKRVIDDQSGIARPFVAWTVGTKRYVEMKDAAVTLVVAKIPEALRTIDNYVKEAMDLQNTLASRLEKLPPPEFEAMLRPAFKEDEWTLVAVGAALGLVVGLGQLFLFTALSV